MDLKAYQTTNIIMYQHATRLRHKVSLSADVGHLLQAVFLVQAALGNLHDLAIQIAGRHLKSRLLAKAVVNNIASE